MRGPGRVGSPDLAHRATPIACLTKRMRAVFQRTDCVSYLLCRQHRASDAPPVPARGSCAYQFGGFHELTTADVSLAAIAQGQRRRGSDLVPHDRWVTTPPQQRLLGPVRAAPCSMSGKTSRIRVFSLLEVHPRQKHTIEPSIGQTAGSLTICSGVPTTWCAPKAPSSLYRSRSAVSASRPPTPGITAAGKPIEDADISVLLNHPVVVVMGLLLGFPGRSRSTRSRPRFHVRNPHGRPAEAH